jgi:sugar phosphate isomerase/epimerase
MANIGDLLIDKQMQLGLHTYTLHLWGLGQNWGVVADPRPKEMNLLQLMDKAVEWGLDGLHITGCDLETKDDTRLLEVKQAAASRNLYLEYNFSRNEEFDPRLTDRVEDGIGLLRNSVPTLPSSAWTFVVPVHYMAAASIRRS